MFPNDEIKEIQKKYNINQCYLDQNLTDTDNKSMFFVFVCNLNCNVREDEDILDILNQIFNQVPLVYELQSETNFVSSVWKTTKEYIKNGSWK